MSDQQFKRNIAYKLRIGDLLNGNPIHDGERFSFLDFNNKKIVRVNVIGNIVDKYEAEPGGEKKYTFLTLDDGSGQIKLKSFGDDVDKLKNSVLGQTVIIIGVLRFFNNELYISPEIIKEQDPKYLLLRKMEVEKSGIVGGNLEKPNTKVKKEEVFTIKDKILELIKNSEAEGGIDTENIITHTNLSGTSKESINQEIKKLLEDGIIFEPRPGRLRWLG